MLFVAKVFLNILFFFSQFSFFSLIWDCDTQVNTVSRMVWCLLLGSSLPLFSGDHYIRIGELLLSGITSLRHIPKLTLLSGGRYINFGNFIVFTILSKRHSYAPATNLLTWWADQNWPQIVFFILLSASIKSAAFSNFSRASVSIA